MPSATFPIQPDSCPLSELTVELTPRREAEERRRAGQPVPEPIRVVALVSTGTAMTGFGPEVLAALNPVPVDDRANAAALKDQDTQTVRTYRLDLVLTLPTGEELIHPDLDVAELPHCSFQQHGFHGVLGRDVLNRYQLRFAGPAGQFTLEWSRPSASAGIP